MPIQEKGSPFGAKKKKKDATDSLIGKLSQKEPPKEKKKPVFEELEEPIEVEENDLPEELEPLKDEPLEEQSEEEVHQAEESEPESNDSESDDEGAETEVIEDKESLKEKFSPLPEESGEQDKSTFFDSEAEKIEEPKEEDFAVKSREEPKAEEKGGFFGAKKSSIYAEENPSSLEGKKRRLGVSERAVNVKAESDASIAKDLFDNEAEDKPEMRKDESQALNIVMVFAIMLLLIAVAASAFLVSGWLSG